MNIEIERKYEVDNLINVRETCFSLGAVSKGITQSTDIYFQVPQKVKKTKYLRLRSIDKRSGILAYHEVIDDLTTKEWEVEVSDIKVLKEILIKLGFILDVIVEKQREKIIFEKCEIVLDRVKNLGEFVEIEAPNEKMLYATAKKLQIDETKVISGAGYPDLLKRKSCAGQ